MMGHGGALVQLATVPCSPILREGGLEIEMEVEMEIEQPEPLFNLNCLGFLLSAVTEATRAQGNRAQGT